ncbi:MULTISPECIES: hypothetical protein [Sutcliffiella]|uniref:Uncharacterized protein n=1 Tax=Sutcliffiella cohnii TaxID=33932 RepID=A0A223KLP8_9BACI|nr:MULTISPECIES: hypothetical protein [Sutcliffiella]AST90430.1 hypothetical protein BC6307_03650 [Sutcliffiella cohnii]WBL16084.1 hypothetical protein O1A01_05465 [Sutcliffiella sp. NC1]
MDLIKYTLLITAIAGQVLGIVLVFISLIWAGVFYALYFVALLVLSILFIIERKKEKEEDDQNDYSDY